MNNDDDLRRLFDDATSEITPAGTLDDILDRTKRVDPMARRWFLPSMAAAAVVALVIGGAFWMTWDGDDEGGATVAASPTAGASSENYVETTQIFYLGEGARGPRLFAEDQELRAYDQSLIVAVAANAAISGTPHDSDFRTPWPDVRVESIGYTSTDQVSAYTVRFAAGSDLARPAGVSDTEARLAVDAVVRTVQAANQLIAPVDFYVGDQRAEEVLGVDTSVSQEGGDDADVLALVSISNVVNNATVPAGRLTVRGRAAAFEGNVQWEILVGGDAVIDSGFTTALEGGALSPYEFETNIPLEGPGTYTLVVHDVDESGEGRPVNQDTKDIVVE